MDAAAVLNLFNQSVVSSSVRTRTPKTRVRSPSLAKSPKCDWMPSNVADSQSSCSSSSIDEALSPNDNGSMPSDACLSCCFFGLEGESRCFWITSPAVSSPVMSFSNPSQTPSQSIEESAPLHNNIGIDPSSSGERTRTDILLRSESNLFTARILHVSVRTSLPSDSLGTFPELGILSAAVSAAMVRGVIVPSLKPFTTVSS
mmetsp:Transcript_12713/g.19707  ORF Transcript_12713/g.19707 Transcript_12713/m.19707 type:complete len:202 (-) Transcript_12713:2172-2777(-)